MKFLRYIILFFLTFCLFQTYAQQIIKVRDVGIWTGLGYERMWNDTYKLSLTQELRLFDNFTIIEELVSDIGFCYKINSNFRLGSNIRYVYDREDDTSYSNDIRYNFDFRYKTKFLNDFSIKYRLRYQQLFGNIITLDRDDIEDKESNFRNKLQVDYSRNDHLFYISSELFRKYEFNRDPYFNKIRFYIGDKIGNSLGEFNFSLAYERELNATYPLNFWFARVYYTFISDNEN